MSSATTPPARSTRSWRPVHDYGDGIARPVLCLSVRIRTETYRSYTAIATPPNVEMLWSDLAAAAVMAMAEAMDKAIDRGLPAPKVRDCVWRGGVLLPPGAGHGLPPAP